MDLQQLEQIIELGESSLVEFKSERFHSESFAKEVVAFSNYKGGDIYIGVEDSGIVSGVSSKKVEEKIVNICRNNITPSLIPEIIPFKINEKIIYKVNIPKGEYRPYKVKKSNKFYIRVGSVSIEPTNEELVRLFQVGGKLHFEISTIQNSSLKDLDLLKFKIYCTDFRKIEFDEDLLSEQLINLDILTESGHITIVGMLFFGKNIGGKLPQSGIELNRFSGKTLDSEILDHKSIAADLPSLVSQSEIFVTFNSGKKAAFNKEQTRRIDKYDYEPFIVRELIVNAFSHRDWSVFGQKIRLNLFFNRLELFSPGGLPNTLNLDKALNGISYYRNPLISQMFRDYNMAEKMGRGLFKIAKFAKEKNINIQYITDPEYFKIIVYNSNNPE